MSELSQVFEDLVERMFADLVSQELLELAEDGKWPDALWNAVEEAGLPRAMLSEAAGGADASWEDVLPLLVASGRFAAPIPLAESILAASLLNRAGLEVPPGVLSVVPAPLDSGTLSESGLSATLKRVPWGRRAEHLVFVAPGNDHARVGLVSTQGAEVVQGKNIALEPRDTVTLEQAPLIAARDVEFHHDTLLTWGAMIRSAQMAGALEALLEMSVGYASERVQFGRPIGKFQAIQQDLARLAGEVAATGMAATTAFHAAAHAAGDARFDPLFEIACAKVRLGDAADLAPGIAHQVHGAIGFTYEHRLHFFTRRLWAWRAEFGTASQWADRLGAMAREHNSQGLWPWLTSRA